MPTPRKKPSLLIPILLLIFLLLLALVGWMLYTLWCDSQQVFHDVNQNYPQCHHELNLLYEQTQQEV